MKKRVVSVVALTLMAAVALAWSYSWYWTNDVWSTPSYSYSPIIRSKLITVGSQYRAEVLYAASSNSWNPGITIECVNANNGTTAWSDHFPAANYNQWAVVQHGVPPGAYYINVRATASQTAGMSNPTQVVIGPTYYYW